MVWDQLIFWLVIIYGEPNRRIAPKKTKSVQVCKWLQGLGAAYFKFAEVFADHGDCVMSGVLNVFEH